MSDEEEYEWEDGEWEWEVELTDTCEDLYEPLNEAECAEKAVQLILKAATYLCWAEEYAQEGEEVGGYVNAVIHLRDLANSLVPDEPAWPTDGAQIYDLKTRQRVN